MKQAYMIIDGQWGSTGKGLIAGVLARKVDPDAVICNFGPNAGHTFTDNEDRAFMTSMLPTAAVVSDSIKNIYIGPGAILDLDILAKELETYKEELKGKDIWVHDRTAVVLPRHKEQEAEKLGAISSTQKGTGAAMADKIMRSGPIAGHGYIDYMGLPNVHTISGLAWVPHILENTEVLQIESAQGLELGINSGSHYPYCTGRDITPAQVLSDCGLPHNIPLKVIATMRTFPIRVGDQYDDKGNKVGTSGPVYDDQKELTWDEMGLEAETTTVTGKIRRIFTWSHINFLHMLDAIRPDFVFLNFVNYLEDDTSFASPKVSAFIEKMGCVWQQDRVQAAVKDRYTQDYINRVRFIGRGPREMDVLYRGMPSWIRATLRGDNTKCRS